MKNNIVRIIYIIKNMYDYETDTIYGVEMRMVYNQYGELIRFDMINNYKNKGIGGMISNFILILDLIYKDI